MWSARRQDILLASDLDAPAANIYRHQHHAGNRADIWKHEVLLELVDHVLRRMPKGRVFRYMETHAGPGHYRPRYGLAHRTRQVLYPGSWLQVLNTCRAEKQPSDFLIIDRYVGPDLRALGHRSRYQRVRGYQGDGFNPHLIQRFCPHLLFIDPPYWPHPDQDWKALAALFKELSGSRVPMAVWYPAIEEYEDRINALCDAQASSKQLEVTLKSGGQGLQRCGMLMFNIN